MEDLDWLVKSRIKSQKLLLKLHVYARTNRAAREKGGLANPLFSLLLGTAFSLWRAAFLTEPTRTKGDALDQSEMFLDILVRDNAIGYYQESKLRSWTFGFYITDAFLRLGYLRDRIEDLESVASSFRKFTSAFKKLERLRDQLSREGTVAWSQPEKAWDHTYNMAKAICDALETFTKEGKL